MLSKPNYLEVNVKMNTPKMSTIIVHIMDTLYMYRMYRSRLNCRETALFNTVFHMSDCVHVLFDLLDPFVLLYTPIPAINK